MRRSDAATACRAAVSPYLSFPALFWWLVVVTFVNRFGGFVLPFLVPFAVRRGLTTATAGLLLTAYGIGTLVATLIGGELADRVGRRSSIVLSMVASAAALLGFAVAQGFALLLAGAFVVGLFAALYKPATEAFVADVVPADRRVSAFAVYRLAVNLGTAAGPAVGGLLADRWFSSLFVGNALASVAVAAIALAALPAGRVRTRADAPAPRPAGRATRPLLGDPALMAFLAGAVLWSLVYFQQLVGLPLQVRSLGFSYALYGALLSLNALLVALFEVPFARFSERRPRHLMVAAGVLLVGLGYGATALAGTPVLLALTVAVWSAGEIVASPVAYAYVADLATEESRGRYQGVWNATFSVGLLGASAGGWLFTAGPSLLWGGCAAACCVGAGLVLVSQRLRRERFAAQRELT